MHKNSASPMTRRSNSSREPGKPAPADNNVILLFNYTHRCVSSRFFAE